MKKRWGAAAAGLVMMAMAASFPVMAAETQDTETEMPETEAQETGTEAVEEILLSAGEREIAVKNETGSAELSAEAKEESSSGDTEEEETASDSAQDAQTAQASLWTVVFSGDDGEQHRFTSVDLTGWTEAVLTENYGFWYLQYTTENGGTGELDETAEAVIPEEELTMWTLTDVYVRESADPEAKAINVASLGDECTVTALLPGWFEVEYDGATGYIRYKYLSDDKSEAEAAEAQEQNARAAQEAAAAAAAAQSNAASGSGSSSGGNGGGNTSAQECLENGLLN